MNERHLTVEELAAREGVPVETVYAWNARGVGPAYLKIGRYARYRLRDVEAWERERFEASGGPNAAA